MPIFAYRSTTREGILAEGVIEAADEKTAVERLKYSGVIPLEVKAPAVKGLGAQFRFRARKVDLVSFTNELSSLLTAGLPLDRGLHILSEISEHSGMKDIVQSLLKSIRGGDVIFRISPEAPRHISPFLCQHDSGRRSRRHSGHHLGAAK
jgi:general secretion pathway protein F